MGQGLACRSHLPLNILLVARAPNFLRVCRICLDPPDLAIGRSLLLTKCPSLLLIVPLPYFVAVVLGFPTAAFLAPSSAPL